MRIAIVGAGAVGGYYGARLAAAGHEVHFLARGTHAEAMRRSGLEVRSELGDVRVAPVALIDDARAVGPVELVIVAVKLWDTEAAARAMAPLVGAETAVLSLQNGVEKEEVIASVIGHGPVLGGVTYILADRVAPGVVVHSGRLQRIVVGELAGGESRRVAAVTGALAAAGIDALASPDVRRQIWEKLVFLAATSAVTAVTRLTIGAVRSHPATRGLLRAAMAEAVEVARGEGLAIADGFVEERLRFADTLPEEGRASMAHDLLRSAPLELEWLSGAVVRRGALLGLPTPVHRTLYAALAPYALGAPPATAL